MIVVLYFKTQSVLFFFQSEGSVRLTYVSNTSNGEHIFSQFSSLSISRLLLAYTSTFIKVACNLLDLKQKCCYHPLEAGGKYVIFMYSVISYLLCMPIKIKWKIV